MAEKISFKYWQTCLEGIIRWNGGRMALYGSLPWRRNLHSIVGTHSRVYQKIYSGVPLYTENVLEESKDHQWGGLGLLTAWFTLKIIFLYTFKHAFKYLKSFKPLIMALLSKIALVPSR